MENSPEALLLHLVVHFAGCRLAFVLPEPGNGELEALIQRADVKMLLFDLVLEERPHRVAGRIDIPLREAAHGRYIATLLYTGGMTGLPKLGVHRSGYYGRYVHASSAFADSVSADLALLICTLAAHTSGYSAFLMGGLSGHTIVLLRTSDAGTALSVMYSGRVTRMMVMTPMLCELLDHPDCLPSRFPALTTLHYTGAAASPARLRRGIEVELRDDDGEPVPVGQLGELYVRRRTVMEGYWNDPERNAEVRDIIVTGGTADNVYFRLLDDFLTAQPAIYERSCHQCNCRNAFERDFTLTTWLLAPRSRLWKRTSATYAGS